MSLKIFRSALALASRTSDVIFSGGEPLAVWPSLKKMVSEVRGQFSGRYISVQTNVTLMNERRAKFFSDSGISVECGIDGDERTTQVNRPGSGICYDYILGGIKTVLIAGGRSTVTMTVHPASVGRLEENVKILAGMGLRSIEVHPAFLEGWNKRSSAVFLEQYRRATAWELKNRCVGVIGREYSRPAQGAWDMLVLPDGKVLPSWVFLSFPEEVRSLFYVFDIAGRASKLLSSGEDYFYALNGFLSGRPEMPSYRRVSNFNAACAIQSAGGKRYSSRVKYYADLCERIEAIDLKVMRRPV